MFFNYITCVKAAGVSLATLAAIFTFGGDLNNILVSFSDTTNNE